MLDAMGGPLVVTLLPLLPAGGTVAVYAGLSGRPISVSPGALQARNLRLQGVAVTNREATTTPAQRRLDRDEAMRLVARHPSSFPVASTFPLADLPAAMEAATAPGTVVIRA